MHTTIYLQMTQLKSNLLVFSLVELLLKNLALTGVLEFPELIMKK